MFVASFWYHWIVPYKDAYDGFRKARLTTMTNLNISTTPCQLSSSKKRIPQTTVTEDEFTASSSPSETASESFTTASELFTTTIESFTTTSASFTTTTNNAKKRRRRIVVKPTRGTRIQGTTTRSTQGENVDGDDIAPDITNTVRTYFPETWLWDLVSIE